MTKLPEARWREFNSGRPLARDDLMDDLPMRALEERAAMKKMAITVDAEIADAIKNDPKPFEGFIMPPPKFRKLD